MLENAMLATALHSPFITMALARKRLAFSTLKLENVLRSSLLVVAHVLENALRVGYEQEQSTSGKPRQQALHCGHSGKSGQRGRRVATGLRGYGACEAAEGVVQKSGAKERKVEWGPALREFENYFCRISFHTGVQHASCVRMLVAAPAS